MSKPTERTVPPAQQRKMLRKFREQYSVTLVEFGQLCGISNPMLSQFENGNRNLSPDAWARVQAAMEKWPAIKKRARMLTTRMFADEFLADAAARLVERELMR